MNNRSNICIGRVIVLIQRCKSVVVFIDYKIAISKNPPVYEILLPLVQSIHVLIQSRHASRAV